ncbi:hypothetical protein GCM10022233_05300 [Streptomyces shaanxiensis]|uniref:Uncharacterized protein n=1 Tax=Streptomyces shaanxiensis TaxID=653357 RepID=A0ABP7UBJ6_9ACTN
MAGPTAAGFNQVNPTLVAPPVLPPAWCSIRLAVIRGCTTKQGARTGIDARRSHIPLDGLRPGTSPWPPPGSARGREDQRENLLSACLA